MRIIILLVAIAAASSVQAQQAPSYPDDAQILVINQCGEAARLVARAAEHYPTSESDRDRFVLNMYSTISTSGLPQHLVPPPSFLRSAQMSMEVNVKGSSPGRDKKIMNEVILAQSAATCVMLWKKGKGIS